MSKVEDNKRQKKTRLFKSAYKLFTSRGFNNTSIADIVEHANVAKGTFYLYFKDKYDLRDQLIEHKTHELIILAGNRAYASDEVKTLEDRLIFIINDIVDTFIADNGLMELISKNLIMGVLRHQLIASDTEENEIYSRFLDMLEKETREYEDAEVLLFTVVEMAGSTLYNSIKYNEPLPPEDYKPYIYRSIRLIVRSFQKGNNLIDISSNNK